jgi:ribosomal protein S17
MTIKRIRHEQKTKAQKSVTVKRIRHEIIMLYEKILKKHANTKP